MTAKIMKGMLSGKNWMLKADQVTQFKVCAFPPNKDVLASLVADLLNRHEPVNPEVDKALRRTAKKVLKKRPCKKWCLLIVAQLDPGNFIFSKEHTKAIAKPQHAAEQVMVANPNGFFDGL